MMRNVINTLFFVIAALVAFPAFVEAGEDPRTVYTKNNGRIDTGTDTSSDGYMRAGTKLVVDCSAAGACVDTPTPPLPPIEGPIANPDTYTISVQNLINSKGDAKIIGWNRPYTINKNLEAREAYSRNVNMNFDLPVMDNDRAGPYTPTLITKISNPVITGAEPFDYSKTTLTITPSSDKKNVNVAIHFVVKEMNMGTLHDYLRGIIPPPKLKISFNYTITDSKGQTSTTNVIANMTTVLSPLVLDLDNDGIEMIPLAQGTMFDINMDGINDQVSWIKSDDGFLTLDRNGDGMITLRKELFGNLDDENLDDGFASLLRYDDNKDYVMDKQDKTFNSLLVWRDLNKDGVGTPNELKSLSAYGIVSINLNAVLVGLTYGTDAAITHQSTYTLKDGSKRQIADVWFDQIVGFPKPKVAQ